MRRLFGLGAAIVLASCGGDSPAAPATSTTPPFTPVVTRVVVSPGTVQLTVGGGATLVASVRDQRDSAMSGKAVTWTSSASGIATVSAAGVLLPVELAGPAFQALHPWLPLTWVVRAFRASLFGAYDGAWASAWSVVLSVGIAALGLAAGFGRWTLVSPQAYGPALEVGD